MPQPGHFNLDFIGDIQYILKAHCLLDGVSSSGKTTDFDSVIRRFDPCHPIHFSYQFFSTQK